ncbi:hypothetical protein OXPF_27640 [Oxobacter pfennigii]|uniref:Uncharacterized protein n=1 Tax=Oxobacter pfennigii TaxID=36849 RepID=A0A0P8WY74_9CLOT|nr:hypothetical protein OXPF_27640 [Oxobacter pfennigii]
MINYVLGGLMIPVHKINSGDKGEGTYEYYSCWRT